MSNIYVMTRMMGKAIFEISKLPENQQDILASIILEEMSSEKKWAELFEKSQDLLANLSEEALDRLRDPKDKVISGKQLRKSLGL